MNEKLNGAISALIEKSLSAFQAGADFLAAEIPDVVYQLLMWKMYYSLILFVSGIIAIVIFVIIDYKLFKVAKSGKKEEDLVFMWLAPGSVVRAVAYIPPLSVMNLDWLKIMIAPKVFLIEYAASLVK